MNVPIAKKGGFVHNKTLLKLIKLKRKINNRIKKRKMYIKERLEMNLKIRCQIKIIRKSKCANFYGEMLEKLKENDPKAHWKYLKLLISKNKINRELVPIKSSNGIVEK